MLNTTHYYRTMKAFYWFIDLMMSWSHKFILWATPEGLIQGPEQRTVMFLFVLISMLIYIASGCWFIFSFCSGDNVIVAWCRGAMNKRASPANSHGARRSPNIQCWNVWISFNLASCWFDWDFSRTHYTLSVSRRLCVCSLSRSHCRIDFFFFVHIQEEEIKGGKKQTREKQRCGIGINATICSQMLSFLDYNQF